MTTKIPLVFPNQTLADVRIELAKKSFGTINYIYVVNQQQKLVGVFSIREIFSQKPSTPVKEIMVKNPHCAQPTTNQERVAYLALKHNLKAIPIVDEEKHLLGVLPADQIHIILNEKHQKYLLQSAGVTPTPSGVLEDSLNLPIFKSFYHRVPWIILGLIGGLLAASIVDSFETVLKRDLIFAAFIPLVVYISDAVGTQTQTLFVRDLAILHPLPIIKYTLKQLTTSILIATTCSIITYTLIIIAWHAPHQALTISASVSIAIISSTFVAIAIPYSLYQTKQDPAIGSGPFATIIQDLLSILIYFTIASLLL